MNEVWKGVKGYGGRYQVSNLGRVRKINKDKRSPQYRYLKPNCNNKTGYYKLLLSYRGTRKNILLHRLIAEAFVINPLNKPCINHIDGNKKNNSVSNLEWTTHKENTIHAFSTGLCDEAITKLEKKINQYDNELNLIKTWKSFHEIERETGYSATFICRQIRHKDGSAYGYEWRYATND